MKTDGVRARLPIVALPADFDLLNLCYWSAHRVPGVAVGAARSRAVLALLTVRAGRHPPDLAPVATSTQIVDLHRGHGRVRIIDRQDRVNAVAGSTRG